MVLRGTIFVMPVSPGDTLDPQRTRRRILDAASAAFNQRGLAAVSITDIARQASASKETIYRAFKSRQGLIDATVADRNTQNEARLERLERDHPDPADRLAALAAWHANWYNTDDFRGCPIVRAVLESVEPLHAAGTAHVTRYRRFLSLIVDQLDLPPERTDQILAVLEGATVLAAIAGPETGRRALAAIPTLAA
jgi:AcrR family transcriptional regulator